jgi:hypothetical protein
MLRHYQGNAAANWRPDQQPRLAGLDRSATVANCVRFRQTTMLNAHQSTSERLSDFRRNPTRESAGCKPRVTAPASPCVPEVNTRKEIYNDRLIAIN